MSMGSGDSAVDRVVYDLSKMLISQARHRRIEKEKKELLQVFVQETFDLLATLPGLPKEPGADDAPTMDMWLEALEGINKARQTLGAALLG